MLQAGQNWDLFGYDVRQLLKHWRAAWREFLWGYDSPVKARLDEGLRVYSGDDLSYFHAGRRIEEGATHREAHGEKDCEAVILPDSLVLGRMLVMPVAVENDLDLAMGLEVTANSPFPEADTGYGWTLVDRDDKNLRVQLAIVSLSSTMSYLGQQYNSHDAQAREVWAELGGRVIVLSGFGERKRLARYNKRLVKVASTIAYCALLLVVISATAAGMKYLELKQLRSLSTELRAQASGVIRMRSAIVNANETITAVNQLLAQRPSPHFEMARLSALLDDDASILQFSIQGTALDVRGVADDAAVVVQQLTDEPAYARVTAPQAITKYFNTGQEQFFLNIELLEQGLVDVASNGQEASGDESR